MNWNEIAAAAAGLVSVLAAIFLTVFQAIKKWGDIPSVTQRESKVITTDTVAMHELAASVEALNMNILALTALLKREIHDREVEREVVERLKEMGYTKTG